jgi:hypothetical protein
MDIIPTERKMVSGLPIILPVNSIPVVSTKMVSSQAFGLPTTSRAQTNANRISNLPDSTWHCLYCGFFHGGIGISQNIFVIADVMAVK